MKQRKMSSKAQNRKQFFRPVEKYKKLTKDVFPKSMPTVDVPEGKLNEKALSKLVTFFSASPEKVEKIGQYILRRLKKECVRRPHFAILAFELCRRLLERCPSYARLFSASICDIVHEGLSHDEAEMQVAALQTFTTLACALKDPSTNSILVNFLGQLLDLGATKYEGDSSLAVRAAALEAIATLLEVRDRVPDALKRLVAVTLGNLAGGSSLPSFSSSPTATADRRRATVASSTPRGRAQSAVPTARPTAESLPSTVPSSILSGEPLLQHVSAARRCWISLAKTVTSSIFPDVLCYSFQACEELEGWKAGEGSFLPPALLLLDERCPVDTSVLFNHLLSYALNSEPRTAVNDTDVRKSVATILGSFIERIDTSLTPSTLRSLTRAFELIPREAQPSPAAEEIASLVSTSVVNLLDRLSGQPQHLDVLSHLAQCVLETYRKVPGKEGSLCRSWALDTLLKASVRSEGKPLGKALGYNLVVPLVHLLEGEDAKMSEFCADILRSLLHRPHSESFRAESLLLTPSSLDAHRSGFGQGLGGYGVLSRQLRLVLYSSAFRIISREDCSKVLSAHLGSLLLRVVEMFGNSDRGLFLSLFLSMLRERRSGDKVKSGIDASIIAIALLGLIKLGEAIGLDEHSRDQLLSALGGKDSLDAVRRKAALDVSGDGELLAFSETTPTSAVPFPRVDEASVVEVLGDASPSSEESTSGNTPSAKERPPAFRPLALPSTAKEPKARPPISKLLRKEGGSESVLLSSTEGDESEAEHEFQPKTAEELFQQSIRTGSLGKQVLLELLRSQDNPSHPSYSNASLDEAIAALQL